MDNYNSTQTNFDNYSKSEVTELIEFTYISTTADNTVEYICYSSIK